MCINPSVFGSDGLGKFVKSKPVAVLGNGAPPIKRYYQFL
ncbi:hypothetical protein JCM19314_2658 [Nonlabens ulvanivorans]|uniref:Uncharacterized protein n=1 Tax=Nonlabens ulvanivorans TaxID=906888 RepID=A0A090Q8T6_NONUL|nr:hypothetical protein JCM19314_2658 [Nonlabens ulvanivorans]